MRYIGLFFIALVVSAGLLALSADRADAQGCFLTIEKSVDLQNDQPFGFTLTDPPGAIFFLSVPSDPTELVIVPIDGSLTVTESVPDGWDLESIECTQGTTNCGAGEFVPCLSIAIDEATNSITATCLDDDEGSCTFTNAAAPREVPTLSEWGLIAMAGVLGLIAFVVLRRKKAVA